MSFLESVFGRKRPTTTKAAPELKRYEAELLNAPLRIERAEATLRNVADLSDAEHEAAIVELAAAERSKTRLEAQVAQLRATF